MKTVSTVAELQALADAGTLAGLYDVPNDIYHAGPGVSSSGLKDLLRSPAHYAERRANPKSSAAMRTGSVVHTLALEPHKFETDYVVADCLSQTAKAFETAKALNPGKTVVCRNEAEDGHAIASALISNGLACNVLRSPGGRSELSVFWTDDETGILCKARADRLVSGTIVDIKTTQDARLQKFQRAIVDFRYHLSAAFYTDGFSKVIGEEHGFAWVVAESERPHGIAFYGADNELIAKGREEYKTALRIYRDNAATKFSASYPETFVNLSLPGWYV